VLAEYLYEHISMHQVQQKIEEKRIFCSILGLYTGRAPCTKYPPKEFCYF